MQYYDEIVSNNCFYLESMKLDRTGKIALDAYEYIIQKYAKNSYVINKTGKKSIPSKSIGKKCIEDP